MLLSHKCFRFNSQLKSFFNRKQFKMRIDSWNGGKYANLLHNLFLYSLYKSPGHILQHRPGSWTGSSHVAFGHSLFMFRHWTLATILLRLVTCNKNIEIF